MSTTQQMNKLDEAEPAKMQSLESELGCFIVALEQQPKLADISAAYLITTVLRKRNRCRSVSWERHG